MQVKLPPDDVTARYHIIASHHDTHFHDLSAEAREETRALITLQAMSPQPDMQAAAKTFFQASTFAVAGASSNPAKFGHKIFVWYLQHDLPAVPLNPTMATIEARRRTFDTVASPAKLSDPSNTSLSIITPPAVTEKLLKEAKEVGIKAVWLQPGTYNDQILDFALEAFPGAAVGGFADGTVGGEGWCVLVDGDQAIALAKRGEKL